VHKLVLEVDQARQQIMDAASLHAQRRDKHAATIAELEQRAAHLAQARQNCRPLQLNGFNLRPSNEHNHVEPSTEEDEEKYLAAAIHLSLSMSQGNLLEDERQGLTKPTSNMRPCMEQFAPPNHTHDSSTGARGDDRTAGVPAVRISNGAGIASDGRAHGRAGIASGNDETQDFISTNSSKLPAWKTTAPQSEPRRSLYRGPQPREENGGDVGNIGIERASLQLRPPPSMPHILGYSHAHTPLSPASVYRAFEQTGDQALTGPSACGGGAGGGGVEHCLVERPELYGAETSGWPGEIH